MIMKITMRVAVFAAAGIISAVSGAQAAPLSVVNVAAPGINCVFSPTKNSQYSSSGLLGGRQ